jgi:hypothetical protein
MDIAALGVRVGSLESDVQKVDDRVQALDTKLEGSIFSLAHELRMSIEKIAQQISERNKTP